MKSLARIISNPAFGYVMYVIAGIKLFNDYKNNNNKSLVIFAMTTITMMNVRKNLPLAILVGLSVSVSVLGFNNNLEKMSNLWKKEKIFLKKKFKKYKSIYKLSRMADKLTISKKKLKKNKWENITLSECKKKCSNENKCKIFQYVGDTCHLNPKDLNDDDEIYIKKNDGRVTRIKNSKTSIKKNYSYQQINELIFETPSKVNNISELAFFNNKLTSLSIPESVTFIGKHAFAHNELNELIFETPSNLKNIADGAFNDNKLESITIPNSVTTIGKTPKQSCLLLYLDTVYGTFSKNLLKEVNFGTESTLEKIGINAFYDNKLESITIPNSVTRIYEKAFSKNLLTEVNFGTESKLEKICINAFAYNNIKEVTIPNSVTYIGAHAFADNDLTKVTIPNSVTHIGAYAFANNNIEEVNIPNSVTHIDVYAFANNNLTKINIAERDTVLKISCRAFANNKNLISVDLPDNVKYDIDAFPENVVIKGPKPIYATRCN